MFLQSSTVLLRKFSPEDAIEYYEIAHDDSVRKWLRYCYTPSLEASISLMEDFCDCDFANNFWFAICDSATGKMVGALLAFRTFSLTLEVCYFIGENYRRHGYCVDALHLLIDFLRKNTAYASLFFEVWNNNASSRAVLRKLGFATPASREYFVYSLRSMK